jgi:hypothetical protein
MFELAYLKSHVACSENVNISFILFPYFFFCLQVILVIVDNKKVTVRVNTTKVDPFFYNPLWDEETPVMIIFLI